jgi:predicted metal-dependent HD superfamily phosphohydrolase
LVLTFFMASPYSDILLLTEQKVKSLYQSLTPANLQYHNLLHTNNVVEAGSLLAGAEGLSEKERDLIVIAAWWHDTGYLFGTPAGHERRGADKAIAFLQESGLSDDDCKIVEGCILATKVPQAPQTKIEEIICDADLFHLGTEDFFPQNKRLRKEIELLQASKVKGKEWRKESIEFLRSHNYFTKTARQMLQSRKLENIRLLAGELEEKIAEKTARQMVPTRGIETMFRLTSSNHMDLSAMADSKANIMISINAIILSVMLGLDTRRLIESPHLVGPTILLLTVNVIAIIFAVLATRPNVTEGTFTEDDIKGKKVNLLFFGNFHRMKLRDYDWGMKEMMGDRDYLYSSLIKDIYFQGVVLGKKYRFLRISYNVFMFGLIAAVIAFTAAFVMNLT